MKKIATFIASIALSTIGFSQNTYTLDKDHARLTFSAFHFGISHIEGIFKTFDATFVSSKEDFTDAQIAITVDVKSLSTEVEMRDNDLRKNWFEVEQFPTLSFKSTSFKKVMGKKYKLTGNITMHGVTKPVSFEVVFNGKGQSPLTKKYLCGFTITGKLNRTDFGVGPKPTLSGVADEIELKSNVEMVIN